jgi:hypothetical protein
MTTEAKTKLTPDIVRDAVVGHYLETGESIFGTDLAEQLGTGRATLDQFIEREWCDTRIEYRVNPATSTQRARNSRAYLPTLHALRLHILNAEGGTDE